MSQYDSRILDTALPGQTSIVAWEILIFAHNSQHVHFHNAYCAFSIICGCSNVSEKLSGPQTNQRAELTVSHSWQQVVLVT